MKFLNAFFNIHLRLHVHPGNKKPVIYSQWQGKGANNYDLQWQYRGIKMQNQQHTTGYASVVYNKYNSKM